ncbi:glycosyltransferase [Bradyrhizobium sp.]|uniref:glycosyltransferase n=1 Tax=Bradyrhizobium sp. TaxID=376 RepID=UPI002B493BDC|nr:glycosyltransferase [Bradyrhizobium sp.]
MDYLIHHPVEEGGKEPGGAARPSRGDWPPQPLSHSWLPRQLQDYLSRSHLDEAIPLFSYLCSVMDWYADDQEAFARSETCFHLLTRIRCLSEQRAGASSGDLDASIIVPVHNNLVDTILCIASLLEHECDASYEIIVADDASTDATTDIIPLIGGVVKHVRQNKNLGFLLNCNAAAAQANGKVVVFLNNDTLVLPGWLDELLAPFESIDKAGLVGSKLLNWDGTLQEAGGIFWEDGSAWNFGRGQDALAPQFNYLKDVDYCSGAAIAVPTSIWKQVDGFDEAFTPAYCEDADLAFRLRDAGYRTVYNPASAVLHHEGRSHGRDVNSGIKAYQVRNQARLLERWGEVLARDHFPNAQQVLRARDRSRAKPHVLFIDHYVPQWDRDAGSRTIYQYLQIFIDLGWQVTFWPDNLHRDPLYAQVLEGIGVEVIAGPEFIDRFDDFLRDRADLYDVVFISRPHVSARYAAAVRQHTKAQIFYYGHDVHFRRMEASMALGGPVTKEDIAANREMELDACRAADVIFYPDPKEVSLIRKLVGGKRKFLTNPVCVYDEAQIDDAVAATAKIPAVCGKRMLFVGGFNHVPNREGIIWFAKSVMPLILERVPEAHLDIVGSNAPGEVVELSSDQVSVLGLVSDERLEELYRQSALAVAPLLHGAGVKGKVIEAMGLAVPVATTSVGAQGIAAAKELMFVGDSPDELAEAVVLALKDRTEAQRRARAAVEFIREYYGRESLMKLFDQLTRKSGKQR